MKTSRLKLILAASASFSAMVLATQAFAGDGNKVYVTQFSGSGDSTITTTQIGNNNIIGAPYPTSSTSVVYYFQQAGGHNNTADLFQHGNAQHDRPSSQRQPGTFGVPGNIWPVWQWQHRCGLSAGIGCWSGVGDNGYNRLGIFNQTGAGNDATLAQTGDRNQVESLTQNGGSAGGHNVAVVTQIGNDNGGAGVTVPFYIANLAASHSVDEVNPSPPHAHTPFVIGGLWVDGVLLNALANLDQTGSYNLAMLGFQGNNNRFNLTQFSADSAYRTWQRPTRNKFLAGANGHDVSTAAGRSTRWLATTTTSTATKRAAATS